MEDTESSKNTRESTITSHPWVVAAAMGALVFLVLSVFALYSSTDTTTLVGEKKDGLESFNDNSLPSRGKSLHERGMVESAQPTPARSVTESPEYSLDRILRGTHSSGGDWSLKSDRVHIRPGVTFVLFASHDQYGQLGRYDLVRFISDANPKAVIVDLKERIDRELYAEDGNFQQTGFFLYTVGEEDAIYIGTFKSDTSPNQGPTFVYNPATDSLERVSPDPFLPLGYQSVASIGAMKNIGKTSFVVTTCGMDEDEIYIGDIALPYEERFERVYTTAQNETLAWATFDHFAFDCGHVLHTFRYRDKIQTLMFGLYDRTSDRENRSFLRHEVIDVPLD